MTSGERVRQIDQDNLVEELRRARSQLATRRKMLAQLEWQVANAVQEINDLKRWAYARGLDPLQEHTSYERF